MPDGTELENVTDLKAYLLENGELFAECLAEKLLIYGTGREPSFGDRRVIRQIVSDHSQGESGFTDLIVAIVLSESFRTR